MGWGWGLDLRQVMRGLRRSPGFVAVAVLSLSVGIGANTAMFGSVRALLLNPMRAESPDELRLVTWRRDARLGISQINSTDYPDPDGGNAYRSNLSFPIYRSLQGQLDARVRESAGRVNRDLPVPELRSQEALVAESSGQERMVTQLLALFGLFALLLASIGLHGVVAYSVGRRTSEIGVRVAVGARPGQVQWLMVRQVLALSALGLAVGVPASVAASPLVGSLLYGVAPTDARVIGGASLLMFGIALAAGYLPARRASRIDPLTALRAD